MPSAVPELTDRQLLELEQEIQAGFASRSLDGLKVMGFGELGVAIGLPTDAPTTVAKRVPASSNRQVLADWFAYIDRYEALVAEHVAVAPTEKRIIATGGGRWAGYLVQRCFPSELLVENIIAEEEPAVGHPIVVAIRDAALSAIEDGRCGIDAQFSNFVMDEGVLTSIDCGSPFMYHPDGSVDYDIGAYTESMPKVLEKVVVKMATKVVEETGTPNGNLELSALSIVRLGQERWLDAVLETFNDRLGTPIERSAVEARFEGLHGQMQSIKRLGRLQRAWVEKVRRRPYEFFITDSFTGEVL